MRRLQLHSTAGGAVTGRSNDKPSGFKPASSLFKVPNKRRAQDVDARTVSTTPNACDDASNDHADNMPPPTAPEDNQAAGKRREEETAPSVVTPLRRANDVDVADVVTAARRICDSLDTNTMRLTGAESELSAASTRALLAASPLRNRPEREAVFQVARRLWNICVGRTNDMLTDVTATRTYSLARADDLAKKRRDAAAMTNLRERCCDLLDASIRSADLSKMSPRDARVGLTFASKTAILLHEENAYERAEEMFERAETYARVLQTWLESRDKADGKDVRGDTDQTVALVFDARCTRASNCGRLGKLDQCYALLGEAQAAATRFGVSARGKREMLVRLISTRLQLGKASLAKPVEPDDNGGVSEAERAVIMLEGTYDIATSHLPASWSINTEGGDAPMAHDTVHANVDSMHVDILRHLAVANVQAEKYAAAKNCVEAISTGIDASRITPNLEFTMHYVSLRANLGVGAVDEATAAATAMIAHPSAKFKSCTPALIQLVTASPKSAAIVVQMFVKLIASTSRDASDDRETIPKAAASLLEAILDAAKRDSLEEVVDAALALVSDDSVSAALLTGGPDKIYRRCYNLMFNHGALVFKEERYHLANKLFQCSLDFQANCYSVPSSGSDPGRAQLLRLQARCHVESGLLEDGLACVKTAEEIEITPSTGTLLLKMKLLMRMEGNEDAVQSTIGSLIASNDPDYLILAVREAEDCNQHAAAAKCLMALHDIIVTDEEDAIPAALKGMEILMLRLALYHHTMLKDERAAGASPAVVIGKLLQRVLDRLKVLKAHGIMELSTDESDYFSDVAWNTALNAVTVGEMTPAAVCFSACARLIPTSSPLSLQVRKASALMMAGACLNGINKQAHASQLNGNVSSQNTANLVKQAKGALSKHQQLVESLLADQEMDSSNRSLLVSTLRAAVLLNHEIACMSGDAGAQLKLITTNNLSADEVAQMADESAQRGSPTAAARGYEIALTMLLAASRRDPDIIAAVIRNRIEIEEKSSVSVGNRQKRILELYASSASHLALLAASYPADEAKWLVTTAFNRGVAHHRMSRFDQALNMFEASKNLLPHALRADPSLCDMQCRIEEAISIVKLELNEGDERYE